MITEAAILTCSICGEPSSEICVYCTKDSCRNHRCERCKRCSDCCECEIPLSAAEPEIAQPPEESAIHEVPPQALEPGAGAHEPVAGALEPEPEALEPVAEALEPVAEDQPQPAAAHLSQAQTHAPEPAVDAPAQPSDPAAQEHALAPEPFPHFYTPRPPGPKPGE